MSGEPRVRPIDRSPARLSAWLAVAFGIVSLATSGVYAPTALAIGAIGLAFVAVGLVRGGERTLTIGALSLLAGGLVAGLRNAPALALLSSFTATALVWDIGHNAIAVGEQLGREATTTRIEALHALASTGVGVLTAGLGYGLYRASAAGQPLAALVFLLVAAFLLTVSLS